MCGADVWNLLAGNTDGIQVVDAGFGKLLKDESEDVACEWLRVPANWQEWTGGRMSASRKRILVVFVVGVSNCPTGDSVLLI